MSAVEVTISGILFDKVNRTQQNVVLIGEATLTGLGPGGGPIVPPDQPPGTWPPQRPPHPSHPIVTPPPGGGTTPPGENPPGIWGGANEPFPTPPIHIPPKPPEPIAPPVSWKAVWHPTDGWIVVGVINPEVEHPVPS